METVENYEKRIKRINNIRLIISAVLTALIIACTLMFKFGSVQSESMLPNLKVGDCVIYSTVANFNKLQQGDIVVYQAPSGILVIHRVQTADRFVDSNGNWQVNYTVKGDNNVYADSTKVTKDNFKGKVVHLINIPAISEFIYKLASNDSYVRKQTLLYTCGGLMIVIMLGFILGWLRENGIEKHRKLLQDYWETASISNIEENENVEVNNTEEIPYIAELATIRTQNDEQRQERDANLPTEQLTETAEATKDNDKPTIRVVVEQPKKTTARIEKAKHTAKTAETAETAKTAEKAKTSLAYQVDKKAVVVAGGAALIIVGAAFIIKYINGKG